jgi:hypothetical protein
MPKRRHECLGATQLKGGKPGCNGNQENDHEGSVAAERIQHAGNLQDWGAWRKRGRGEAQPPPELAR